MRKKFNYVGAPAIFALEQACTELGRAYPEAFGCYLVGSAIERADWRDVDVRMILADEDFQKLFPDVPDITYACWEHDARWVLHTVAIAGWMTRATGLPVDFQFQPQSWANAHHRKGRHALGLTYVSPRKGS